ncbi:hypothetical protein FRB99_000188 [Tulasnella sp. 403]|nr:hypothetical protein FRB99_000188 [Tulasnella sp. 403]
MERKIQIRNPSPDAQWSSSSKGSLGRGRNPPGVGEAEGTLQGDRSALTSASSEHEALGEDEDGSEAMDESDDEDPLFFVDPKPENSPHPPPAYEVSFNVLGEQAMPDEGATDLELASLLARSCFNCSSPSHLLPSCPEPRNPSLIASNRAAYTSLKASLDPDLDSDERAFRGRFYEIPIWRAQRLEWVDAFEPGKIKGAELREALGLTPQEGGSQEDRLPWFDGGNAEGSCGGMLFWGFPPGWVGEEDPKELMRHRILSSDDPTPIYDVSLTLHNDSDTPETINILAPPPPPSPPLSPSPSKRWATYNTSLFLSSRLPISNVICPLPPLPPPPPPVPSTFTQNRQALWASLVAGTAPPKAEKVPPWREPDAFDFEKIRYPAGYIGPRDGGRKGHTLFV